MRAKRPKVQPANHLITAADFASLCQVDLKSIHNWCNKGQLKHIRTPGRHLRFHVQDVIEFCQRQGFTVPQELRDRVGDTSTGIEMAEKTVATTTRARIFVVSENGADAESVSNTLGDTFDVVWQKDPLIGVARAMGAFGDHADVMVLVPPLKKFTSASMTKRLRAAGAKVKTINYCEESLAYTPTVMGCNRDVVYGDVAALREAICSLVPAG